MSRPAISSGVYAVTPGSASGPSLTVNIGTISTRPPIEMATVVSTANHTPLPSRKRWKLSLPSVPWLIARAPSARRGDRRRGPRRDGRLAPDGPEEVPAQHDRTDQVHRPADQPHPVERVELVHDVHEDRILELAARVDGAPHQPLGEPGGPHRDGVEHDADGREPEVDDGPAGIRQGPAPQPRNQPVDDPERDHPDPAECAAVHVADDPVG